MELTFLYREINAILLGTPTPQDWTTVVEHYQPDEKEPNKHLILGQMVSVALERDQLHLMPYPLLEQLIREPMLPSSPIKHGNAYLFGGALNEFQINDILTLRRNDKTAGYPKPKANTLARMLLRGEPITDTAIITGFIRGGISLLNEDDLRYLLFCGSNTQDHYYRDGSPFISTLHAKDAIPIAKTIEPEKLLPYYQDILLAYERFQTSKQAFEQRRPYEAAEQYKDEHQVLESLLRLLAELKIKQGAKSKREHKK